jgi:hypothetical protein
MSKPIYVTQPFLPPLEEFVPYHSNGNDGRWKVLEGVAK